MESFAFYSYTITDLDHRSESVRTGAVNKLLMLLPIHICIYSLGMHWISYLYSHTQVILQALSLVLYRPDLRD